MKNLLTFLTLIIFSLPCLAQKDGPTVTASGKRTVRPVRPVVKPKSDKMQLGLQSSIIDFYPFRPWANVMHGAGPWKAFPGDGRRLAQVDSDGNALEPAISSLKTSGFNLPSGNYSLSYDGGTVSLSGAVTSNSDGTYQFGDGSVLVHTDGLAKNITVTLTGSGKYIEETVGPLRGHCDVWRTMPSQNVTNAGQVTANQRNELFSTLSAMGIIIPVGEQTTTTFLDYSYNRFEPLWANRTPVTHTRWSTRTGVPIEEEFALMRELKVKTPWLTVPLYGDTTRDNDYAFNLGALVANEWMGEFLVEFGNEFWNRGFQYDDLALARGSTIEAGEAVIISEVWPAFLAGYASAGGNTANAKLVVMGWLYSIEFGQNLAAELTKNGIKPHGFGASFYLAGGKAVNEWRAAARIDPSLPNFTARTMLDDLERTAWSGFASGLNGYADLATSLGAKPMAYEGMLSTILGGLAGGVPRLNQLAFQMLSDPYADTLFTKMLDELVKNKYSNAAAFAVMHNTTSAKDGLFALWRESGVIYQTGTAYLDYFNN